MEKAIFISTHLLKEAQDSLSLLKNADFKLIGLINKSKQFDSNIDAYYYCPHFREECDCHLPKAGLLFEAAKDLNLDLKKSWLIGQTLDEMEAANRAGCKTILLANGVETQWQVTPIRQPEFISANFEYAAGTVILKNIYQMILQEQADNYFAKSK